MAKRTYLLTMFIAAVTTELARIEQKLTELSHGELQLVERNKGCIAFLFNSAEAFDDIGRTVDSVTLSTDSFLLTEVGLRTWHLRLGRAAGWLKNNQPAPQ